MRKISFYQFFHAKSIRDLLKLAFVIIISCFLGTSIINLLYMRQIISEYGQQISNIEFANTLSQVAQERDYRECWYIVAGRQEFESSDIYDMIDSIQRDLSTLYDNTMRDDEGHALIAAALRANETLRGYAERLGEQCENGTPVSYRQMTLSEINKVSNSLYNVLREFAYAQIAGIARANEDMQRTSLFIMVLLALLSLAVISIAFEAYRLLKEAVNRPNLELAAMADRILEGDLATEVPPPGPEELNKLADSINLMAGRIRMLLDRSIEEQRNLQKAELRALQAQIAPHFLYNTFDTIVWLAEGGHNEEVISVTLAFSHFCRIALSRGREFITVREEVQHVRDYLVIQSIRYKDILHYEIDIDPAMEQHHMLKLLLQPLVENALYHGIKNKRGGGQITILGRVSSDDSLHFTVTDNGMGMTPDTLQRLRADVCAEQLPETSGYGLYNVNRRLRVFYGAADLLIESEYGCGTNISFSLPERGSEPT